MKLKPLKKKTCAPRNHLSNIISSCFNVCFAVAIGFLITGCNENSASSPESTVDESTVNSTVISEMTDDETRDEYGLPALHCNLKDSVISTTENPVCLDGHNPFLPFPSDVFAYKDETSPTGVRLKITNAQFPSEIKKILEKLPESLQLDTLYKEPDGDPVDGFSISINVLFEFDRPVDPDWVRDVDENMARDGGDTFYLMDLTTGEFIDALAKESHYAKDSNRTTRDYVMQVMARKRFEFGRRYMAFVTKNFKDKDGNDFSCSSGFEKAKSGDGSPISKFYEPWLKYLETEKGISRDDLLQATIFTTKSREASIGPLVDMYKTVLKDDFTDEHVRIHNNFYFPYFNLERIVYGKINLRDYRDEEGVLNYTAGFKGTRDIKVSKWVPFLLLIPHHSFPKPYPVNISGSGIVMTKEMMAMTAGLANAALGIATMTIDWPSHGERAYTEHWTVWEGVGLLPGGVPEPNAGDMPRLLSMFMQIPVDVMSTYRALTTYFANSDKKGIRDIDTDNMTYSGYSLGALSGTAAGACIPNLKGVFLSGAPVNFNKLLSCGTFLLGGPSLSMPEGIPGSWYAIAMNAIVSQKGDMFDGMLFADGFRNGVPEMGTGPRPLMATYARNDGWVTAESGVALMEIAELPLIYRQDDVAPYDLTGFINNLIGAGAENNLDEYDNYGMAEITVWNNDFKINEFLKNSGMTAFAKYVTCGLDTYDISGTLEHAFNAFINLTPFYYMMHFNNNVQLDGRDWDLYNAAEDFDDLTK